MTALGTASDPIGIFDSGVGGLTVLKAIRALLPQEHLIYVGDTARVPYGTKSPETVVTYSRNLARHLLDLRCKAIVIACNTASAFAAEAVQAMTSAPVIDVVQPVSQAVASAGHRRVLVLGTRGTVASGAYLRALRQANPELEIVQQACPLFVPLAEEGWSSGDVPRLTVEHYLREPFAEGPPPDALILGCTHYPVLRATIEQVARHYAGGPISLYDSGPQTALRLGERLSAAALRNTGGAPGSVRYQVTDAPETFLPFASRFLGEAVQHVEHIDLATR